jgi:beta-lactam-binding protein with PASTA domain
MTEEQVEETVDDLDLDYVLLDSVDFNPAFPKHTVVEQDPMPGAKVKKNRKIYIKINSSGFTMVRIPNLIQKTYRQAVPTLKSLGLEPGEITYKPDLAKDMVLEMHCNGKKLNPGDKIFKSSKIDLVLGDGNEGFVEPVDSLSTETTPDEQ